MEGKWHPLSVVLIIVAIFVAVVVLAVLGRSSSATGASAAEACINAYEAGSQFKSGQRSLSSALSALQGAEAQERDAATANSKYQTVVDDIIGLEADLNGVGTGGHLSNLNTECGPAHQASP